MGFAIGATLAIAGFSLPMKAGLSRLAPADAPAASALASASAMSLAQPSGVQMGAGALQAARLAFFSANVPYGSIICREAEKSGIPAELIAAVIETESGFRRGAQSHKGARGLMQIIPSTASWMGARNIDQAEENIRTGSRYLAYLHRRFEGNLPLVLAAYNAGEGNVRKYGGVPPFPETRQYLVKVSAARERYENAVANRLVDWSYAAPAALAGSN